MAKAATVILAMRDQIHYLMLMLAPSANNNRRDKA